MQPGTANICRREEQAQAVGAGNRVAVGVPLQVGPLRRCAGIQRGTDGNTGAFRRGAVGTQRKHLRQRIAARHALGPWAARIDQYGCQRGWVAGQAGEEVLASRIGNRNGFASIACAVFVDIQIKRYAFHGGFIGVLRAVAVEVVE